MGRSSYLSYPSSFYLELGIMNFFGYLVDRCGHVLKNLCMACKDPYVFMSSKYCYLLCACGVPYPVLIMWSCMQCFKILIMYICS
jgi:hypothetical protein